MGSSIIEVGVGLVLVYMLLSLLVSQINNIIKNLLDVRGDYFVSEVGRLISDPQIRSRLMTHPAIQVVMDGDMIKNITADRLADVLVDILAGSGEALEYLEQLNNSALVERLLEPVNDPTLRHRLEQVLATARSLPDARAKLVDWFDSTLNRMGELYKRRMQFFSLLVGALLAILLNVDTLALGRALWNDPVLRQATVDAANTTMAEIDLSTAEPGTVDESIVATRQTVGRFLELRLPIGWVLEPVDAATQPMAMLDPLRDSRNLWNFVPGNSPYWLTLWLEKIGGLILTTVAVMQGAPFWFDLLKRATGK